MNSFAEGCWSVRQFRLTTWCQASLQSPQSLLKAKRELRGELHFSPRESAVFTRAPRRSHEDWNTHRQPSGSVMDINLTRRVKKQQLTEQAESQIDWLTIGEVYLSS